MQIFISYNLIDKFISTKNYIINDDRNQRFSHTHTIQR